MCICTLAAAQGCSSSSEASSKSSNVLQNGSSSSSGRSDKIVSLLPSGTEILYALGLGFRVVGVSGFCDYPAEACSKPVAVRSLIDVDAMTSDEIEQAMQVGRLVVVKHCVVGQFLQCHLCMFSPLFLHRWLCTVAYLMLMP
jgi:hypothetical protein